MKFSSSGVSAAILVSLTLATVSWAAGPQGYLAPGAFDLMDILPPAPVKNDARYKADRQIFRATRSLRGTPRYDLATSDVDRRDPAMLRNFSCAVGVALTPENAPRTQALIDRALIDTLAQANRAKDHYRRDRPFNLDKGQICQPKESLRSFDYPSGHTTLGWTWAYVLADLVPERGTQILTRGRAYGESRYICGAHNASAVQAGAIAAAATMSIVRTTPAYQADAVAARSELRALLADPNSLRPNGCATEANLLAQHGL